MLDLLDTYAAGWPYLVIGFCELILISHIYGIQNFFDDMYTIIQKKMGFRLKTFVYFVYMFVSPGLIFVILVISWASHKALTKGSYTYPAWADGIGFLIAFVIILSVPFTAFYLVGKELYNDSKKVNFNFFESIARMFKKLLTPTENWRTNALKALDLQDEANSNTKMAGEDNKGANID